MAHEDYNKVEITDEEMKALNDVFDSPATEGESTATEEVETVQSVEDKATTGEASIESLAGKEETETEVVKDGFEIDGERYSLEEIQAWREDSDNKSSWQKSNTEKAQSLSKWGKLGQKINEDENFRDHLKDFFFDDPEAVKALGLDGDIDIPAQETKVEEKAPEISPELNERLKVLENIEGERVMESRVDKLDGQLTKLEEKFPEYLEGEKVAEFLEFADKNANKFVENGLPDLDRAFREWSYAEMQTELAHYKKLGENGARNEGKIINTAQVGAKEVKTPKKYNWDNMTMDDPDIAKYFDK